MNILLGNLTVSEIEKRIGIDFPQDVRDFMNDTHHSGASNIPKGKWHCFDIPFNIVCGDIETATIIYNSLKERSSEVKEKLQISFK